MSMESAKAFIERMKTDEDFVKEVAKCKEKEERNEFVASQGFQFTDKELKTQASELTDEELNAISAGSDDQNIGSLLCGWKFG